MGSNSVSTRNHAVPSNSEKDEARLQERVWKCCVEGK